MKVEKPKKSLPERLEGVVVKARDILPHARMAVRKPAAIAYILLDAHLAQLVSGVALIILIFLAPPIVDSFTSALFPPETSTKVFGLIKSQQANPAKVVFDVILMTALWLVSILSSLLLFWLYIPAGLDRANGHAKNLLTAGDSHGDTNKSRILYERALAITTDHELESELYSRLRKGKFHYSPKSSTGAADENLEQDYTVANDNFACGKQTTARGMTLQSQAGLNKRYTLGPELGRGAMGAVFRARDDVLEREVAVKQLYLLLSGEKEFAQRFHQEAKALARLTHPNIVQVYDLIEDRGGLWMVLEYVDGGDLASYLEQKERISIDEAAKIIISVGEGLAFAHKQGIVHRDLKPANILLTRDRQPKISDFGIAKLSQSGSLTQVGSVLGSPPYMSPEQCSGGAVDNRTDIYALGITLYELLSGKRPFEGETSSVLARQIVEQPPPLSAVLKNIPAELESLISRMLAKKPDERPSEMSEIINSLSALSDGTSSRKQPLSGKTVVG